MALARTQRLGTRSSEGHGTGVYTTASFTPSDNSLLVVVASCVQDSGTQDPSDDMTISDSVGLTWTARANIGNATEWSNGLRIWTAPVTTGASMTVSLDAGALNIWRYGVGIWDFTGYNTSTPTGATATGGNSGSTGLGSNGAVSITLSASPASTSHVIAVMCSDINGGPGSVAVGTGWTELFDETGTDTMGIQAQVRTGSTSTTVGWDDVNEGSTNWKTIGIALEILEGSGTVYTLTAESSSYTWTGTAALVLWHKLLTATTTSYAWTGTAALLYRVMTLVADSGSYTWTGTNVNLLWHKLLNAVTTSYAWTGTVALLTKVITLAATPSSYAWSGTVANLLRHGLLSCSPGSYTWTGSDATLTVIPAASSGKYWPYYE